MKDSPGGSSRKKAAAFGILLIFTPLFFVSAAVLKFGFGLGLLFDPLEAFFSDPDRLKALNLLTPIVFLGSSALALALNARAILRLRFRREESMIVGTVTIDPAPWDLSIIALSSVLLVVLVGYAFLENFTRPL